jgi:hypothetical protein
VDDSHPARFLCSISTMHFDEKPDKKSFNWAPYLDGFVNERLSIIDLADRVIRGHSFGPVYKGRPDGNNFVAGQLLALDFDTEDARSSMDTLLAHPFILAYACLIYPSPSHRPDAPRHRAVFALDSPIQGREGWEMAGKTVLRLFPHADQGTYNAARTFFGNGKILRDGLPMYYNETVLPLSHLRVMAKQMLLEIKQQEQRREQQVRRAFSIPKQVGEVPSLVEVMDRLQSVNPYALSYDQWIKIGAALAHTYGDDAFIPYKSWSDQPGHEPLSYGKWKSLGAPVPNPAGIGSVIQILKERNV